LLSHEDLRLCILLPFLLKNLLPTVNASYQTNQHNIMQKLKQLLDSRGKLIKAKRNIQMD
jgi:hypothetical protein